jgi:hypothetical protein
MSPARHDLNALADQLAPTFPGRDDAPLALALLNQRWPNLHYDEARVVAFGGAGA